MNGSKMALGAVAALAAIGSLSKRGSQSKRMTFISDMGRELEVSKVDGSSMGNIPRYAVWTNLGRGKSEVAELSNDLSYLMKKWNIPKSSVVVLPSPKGSRGRWEAELTNKVTIMKNLEVTFDLNSNEYADEEDEEQAAWDRAQTIGEGAEYDEWEWEDEDFDVEVDGVFEVEKPPSIRDLKK